MKHLAECTWCVSLVMNSKKYRNHKIHFSGYRARIEVDTKEEVNLIEQLNEAQKATFKIYNELLK